MERGEVPLLLMDNIMCVNVRELNHGGKEKEIKQLIDVQKPGLVALLETRIKPSNMGRLYLRLFQNWCFSSNSSWDDGGRIVLA